jgi:hypothetical protein
VTAAAGLAEILKLTRQLASVTHRALCDAAREAHWGRPLPVIRDAKSHYPSAVVSNSVPACGQFCVTGCSPSDADCAGASAEEGQTGG